MVDPRVTKLAQNLVNFSCNLQKGQTVIIEITGGHYDMARELVKAAYAVGAFPYVWLRDTTVMRQMLLGGTAKSWSALAEVDGALMDKADAYIAVRGGGNANEYSDVPGSQMELYSTYYGKPVHFKRRIPNTHWVVTRWPSPSMSQSAQMSTESFEDYYFDVCCLDYSKMEKAFQPLKELMERTDRVRITAKGTDISFSIKGLPVIPCAGKQNIPDGEIFTAPVSDSVNGVITYNTPSLVEGFTFTDVCLRFENGKIVEATSNNVERINQLLDTDEGARYVGEFAIGVNPYITSAIKDTLFDEKITGSIHFTPGCSYDDCDNGNKSAVHWDLVLIQTPQYGGGEIYFDDVLIRKDGLFVLPELECLNPENLV